MFYWVSEGYTKQKEEGKQGSNRVMDSFLIGPAEQRCEDPVGSSLQRVFNKEHLGPSTRESRPPGVLPRSQRGTATWKVFLMGDSQHHENWKMKEPNRERKNNEMNWVEWK